MQTVEIPNNEVARQNPELISAFYESYRHSQGDDKVAQPAINTYFHRRHPDWRMSDGVRDRIYELTMPALLRHTLSDDKRSPLHTKDFGGEETIRLEARERLKALQFALNQGGKDVFLSEIMYQIETSIISSDTEYVWKGRPGRNRLLQEISERKDPYFSYIVDFVVKGNTTGSTDMDTMYGDIRQHIRTICSDITNDTFVHPRDVKNLHDIKKLLDLYKRQHGYLQSFEEIDRFLFSVQSAIEKYDSRSAVKKLGQTIISFGNRFIGRS